MVSKNQHYDILQENLRMIHIFWRILGHPNTPLGDQTHSQKLFGGFWKTREYVWTGFTPPPSEYVKHDLRRVRGFLNAVRLDVLRVFSGWISLSKQSNHFVLYCVSILFAYSAFLNKPLRFSCGRSISLCVQKPVGNAFFLDKKFAIKRTWIGNRNQKVFASEIRAPLVSISFLPSSSGWWFQTFFIFTPTWGSDPIWLLFFKWVETTN